MEAELKSKVDNHLGTNFGSKSYEGASLNDLLDTLPDESARVEALAYFIQNRGFVNVSDTCSVPTSRRMSNEQWREIIGQSGLIFRAVIDTAFKGYPPAREVSKRFLDHMKGYSDQHQRDVLMGLLVTDRRVPYPLVPDTASLPKIPESEIQSIFASISKDVRLIDFMLKEPTFTEYEVIAAVMAQTMDGFADDKKKLVYLTGCLNVVQAYLRSAMQGDS